MDQKTVGRTAAGAINATARYVRRSAQTIRARGKAVGEPISERLSERLALSEWAALNGKQLSFDYIEQFRPIGSGAEHRVYHDQAHGLAVKATHTNRFGHSTYGEGVQATPSEYLRRLAWCNLLFGDDYKIIGVAFDEEQQIEIVCSQPWIVSHPIRPVPFENEIDSYFQGFGFLRSPLNPDAPVFYHLGFNLIITDAHDTNILRDSDGHLAAIDVVVGTPGPSPYTELRTAFKFASKIVHL
jgi:serine/threonin/tyrosin kinase-like protein